MSVSHQFNVGDLVVYTNDFGVCWGVKTITALDERTGQPTYHYEGSDTPWYSVNERNFVKADVEDRVMDLWGGSHKDDFFQEKHGFTPTLEQLGGCY